MKHHLNVVGDFYVEAECCTACGVPQTIAPELFASLDEHDQCFVKRQPQTQGELGRMIEVMATQELGCIRYGGRDETTIQRIRKISRGDLIDPPSAEPVHPSSTAGVAVEHSQVGTKSWWKFW